MSSETIIVVENGRKISGLLRDRGYSVTTARDGDGALGILATEEPDLLVLDMAAPQLDTIEMCKRARAVLGDDTPIILLAPADDPGTLHTALKSGATDYLLTVERPEQIVERLEVLAFGPKDATTAEAESDIQKVKEHVRAQRATKEVEEVVDEDDIFEQRAKRAAARGDRGHTSRRKVRYKKAAQPMRIIGAKWLAIALGSIWLMGAGYHEILRPDPMQSVRSLQLKREVGNCRGTYNARYRCKSGLLVASKNSLFGAWTRKIGVVFIPILILSVLYHSVLLKVWGDPRAR
jgi:DNA-binding response OmpR family regulator